MPRRCQDRCVGRSVKSYPLEFAVFRVVAQETERRSDRRQNCSAAQERLSGQSACFFRIAFAHAQDRTIGLAPRCRILPGHAFVKRDRSREPSSVAIGHPTVERSYRGAFRVRSCRDKNSRTRHYLQAARYCTKLAGAFYVRSGRYWPEAANRTTQIEHRQCGQGEPEPKPCRVLNWRESFQSSSDHHCALW